MDASMKVGDTVMFNAGECRYARWFFGRFAIVERYTPRNSNDDSCRVRWLEPVKYHDGFTTVSDFSANKFQVCS